MKPKPVVCGLAFAALFFAVLLPPEAYPDGKMAVLLCATFAFIISMIEHRIASRYLWGGLCLFGFLLIHSFWISVDLYRSLDFVAVVWTYYCLLGFFLYAGFEPLKPFAFSMTALSVIVSAYGLYQYFWGFDQLYNFVFYSGSDQVVKVPALDRIATRRVYSTLALPGTLWGFLVAALPLHAVLWNRKWLSLTNVGLALSASALLATGFLTRSFGFLLGLFVLTMAWLLIEHRRLIWNKLTPVILLLAIAAGTFYWARRGVIEGSNPAGLRLTNWISAWTIFATHPAGTGGNTYGVVYPRYMLPGSNETQYAHNTPLQLLSEFGFPVLLLGAALFLIAIYKWAPTLRSGDEPPRWVVLAVIVWSVHNLVDINVYFPSMGVIGAVLLGVLLRKQQQTPAQPNRLLYGSVSVLATSAIIFSGLAMVSSELRHRAQVEYQEHKMAAAIATLNQAKSIMPIDSGVFHEAGDILLDVHSRSRDPKDLEAASESFRRAIALSPMKVGPHVGLGLCLSWNNDLDAALKEVRTAEELYPDSTYVQSVVKLMEGRRNPTP